MKRFQNILVAVDLSLQNRLVSKELPPPTQQAIAQAINLAKSSNAKLQFYYVLPERAANLHCESQTLLKENHGQRTVKDYANEVVVDLAERAKKQGVKAEGRVGIGNSWIELIRHVQLGKHDLLIAGTRHRGSAISALLGSTGIKLLRKCPCPVWITQPGREIKNILVAHDLTPVGELALQLGASMARLLRAELHVLHALNYPDESYWYLSTLPEKDVKTYRAEAEKDLKKQVASLAEPTEIGVVENSPRTAILVSSHNSPSTAIVDYLNHHDIDLLVMGTVARTGIAGLIMGNTAEKLLPAISCSVLAVKPEGFRTPVTPE